MNTTGKLLTSEKLDLISAIEESFLLTWRLRNDESAIQFPKLKELRPFKNPREMFKYMEMLEIACKVVSDRSRKEGSNEDER
jgi:hypothetical protein